MKEKQKKSAEWKNGFGDGIFAVFIVVAALFLIYVVGWTVCSSIDAYLHHIVRAEVQNIKVNPRAQLVVNCYNLTEVKGKTTELSGTKCDVPENTIFRNSATGSDHVSYWDAGSQHIAYKVQP